MPSRVGSPDSGPDERVRLHGGGSRVGGHYRGSGRGDERAAVAARRIRARRSGSAWRATTRCTSCATSPTACSNERRPPAHTSCAACSTRTTGRGASPCATPKATCGASGRTRGNRRRDGRSHGRVPGADRWAVKRFVRRPDDWRCTTSALTPVRCYRTSPNRRTTRRAHGAAAPPLRPTPPTTSKTTRAARRSLDTRWGLVVTDPTMSASPRQVSKAEEPSGYEHVRDGASAGGSLVLSGGDRP